MELKDDDLIKFGKYKGTKLIDVDRNYFLFLYDRGKLKGELLKWVQKNHPIINYGKKK